MVYKVRFKQRYFIDSKDIQPITYTMNSKELTNLNRFLMRNNVMEATRLVGAHNEKYIAYKMDKEFFYVSYRGAYHMLDRITDMPCTRLVFRIHENMLRVTYHLQHIIGAGDFDVSKVKITDKVRDGILTIADNKHYIRIKYR